MLTEIRSSGQMDGMPYLVIPGTLVVQLGNDLQFQIPTHHELDKQDQQPVDLTGYPLRAAPERVDSAPPVPPGPGGVVF